MSVSLQSQIEAMKKIADMSPAQIVRAGLTPRPAQAEVLRTHLEAAFTTLALVASDDRLRAYVEKQTRGANGPR